VPKVWIYALCYNEAYMMPYFLRHYTSFAEKVIIYDAQSTDGTRGLVAANPRAELRDFTLCQGIDDNIFVRFVNEQYKEARGQADWVIWVDCDEFVYHPHLLEVLREYQSVGVNIVRAKGYLMVSDEPAKGEGQIYDEARLGLPDRMACKPVIFRPSLEQIEFSTGRHGCEVTEDAVWALTTTIKLLHYRYFGKQYLLDRNAKQFSRLSEANKTAYLGFQVWPDYNDEWGPKWYDEYARVVRMDVVSDQVSPIG